MKLTAEQPAPLVFETVPELLAFYYRKYGAEVVREILEQSRLGHEKLEACAAEFNKIGLSKLAALVRSAVDKASKKIALNIEGAGYSSRVGQPQTWTVQGSGDKLTLVASPRKDQRGTFTPHLEIKRP
jgi:hypothetical protein